MIDTLQRIAARIRPLRYVAFVVGLACLAAVAFIIFGTAPAGEANRYLLPAMVGFIWCLSAYGFIDGFQVVPERAGEDDGFVFRVKRRIYRAWFWLLAVVFAASTIAALVLTFKLAAVWLDTYHG